MNKKVCFIGHRQVLHKQVKDRLTKAIQNEINDGNL